MQNVNLIKYTIILVIVFLSCSKSNKNPCQLFNKKEKLQSKVVNVDHNDKFILGEPFLLVNIDSTILTTDIQNKKYFTGINLRNKNTFRFGEVGHGPGEFLPGTFFTRSNERRKFYIYNSTAKRLYKTSIDSFIKYKNYKPSNYIKINSKIRKIGVFNDSLYLAQGNFKNYRLALFNKKGELLSKILKYPNYNSSKNKIYYSLAYQGKTSIKPNNSKFVHITFNSSNIGFYHIKDNELHIIRKIFLQDPNMKLINVGKGDAYGCIPNTNCITGYIDVYATKKYIYALYSNKKFSNNKRKESSKILVFDWNGMPIKILRLDKEVRYICVSSNDKFLNAIYRNDERVQILSYEL
jgi:hypothetical protein